MAFTGPERLIEKLALIPDGGEVFHGVAPLLERWCARLAEVFDAEGTSAMVFDGEGLQLCAHYGDLPSVAYRGKIRRGEGIAGHVLASGKPLLVENIEASEFFPQARYPQNQGKSFLSVPLLRDGLVAGIVNVRGGFEQPYKTHELQALSIAGLLVERDIQLVQMRGVLRSNFITVALEKAHRPDLNAMVKAAEDPGKLAKLLARSFYRELRRAGFASTQIIMAATEIISGLGTSLRDARKKIADGPAGAVEKIYTSEKQARNRK